MKPLLLIVGFMLIAGCVDQGVFIQREEAVEVFENALGADVTSFDLGTYNGYVAVHLWDSQTYKVEVRKWARGITTEDAKENLDRIHAEVSVTGTMLVLTVEEVREGGADVTAYLPRKTYDTVEISTSNGYVEVEEMTATQVSLETSNGHVDASVTAENITVKTSNARVEGFFQGEMVDIETSNGEVDVTCGDGGMYKVDTSNARVTVKARTRGEFTITTSNGGIDMTVEGDFSFDLRTSNSHIEVEAEGVTYTVDSSTHKKGSTAAAPGVVITASTSNASITVKK